MKKLLLTTVLTVACVSAFAQGKVTFGNDANHLVTFTTDALHLTQTYSSLSGVAVPQTGAAGPNMGLFTVELWAGTTAAGMTLQSTVNGAAAGFADGRFPNTSPVTLTGVPAGSAFFQVRLWETAAGSWNATQTGAGRSQWLQGSSPVFTAVAGSFLPNSIVLSSAPSLSTWANGPIQMGTVDPVPEPSAFALAGLGAAAMLIFRRRK